jgi:uncharacterized RDD family membrane protein YckC
MAAPQRDHSLGKGVYYAQRDYQSLTHRLLIWFIDACVLGVGYVLLGMAFVVLFGENTGYAFLATFLLLALTYLVVCKPSKFRTAGYWLTGTEIVDLCGRPPSVFRMAFRTLLLVFVPGYFVFDLMWCGMDRDLQSLRDCVSGTYVVKKGARPIGTGLLHLGFFGVFGFSLMYPRVARTKLNPKKT